MSAAPNPVRLPYRAAWTPAAVEAVLEALPWLAERGADLTVPRLRQLVKDQAALLALMGWLAEAGLTYTVGVSPLARMGREPLWVGGRRLFLYATLIARREAIRALRRRASDPAVGAYWAAVPEARWRPPAAAPEDILVFAYLLGLTARHPEDTPRLRRRNLPLRLVHLLPAPWHRLSAPRPLALRYAGPGGLEVTLWGRQPTGVARQRLRVAAGEGQRTAAPWVGVFALSTADWPKGRLSLAFPDGATPHRISPAAWDNLWIYGLEVWLLGYLSRRAFAQRARYLPSGFRKAPGVRAAQGAYAVPLAALRPMTDLLARLWGAAVQ